MSNNNKNLTTIQMSYNLVVKANAIIEASYILSINEQRLLLACISQLRSDEDFDVKKGVVLSVEQAQDLFYGSKNIKNAYRDLEIASKKLWDRGINLKSENGRFEVWTRWVSTVKLDKENKTVTLFFHDQIKQYISQLRSNFTKYRLRYICQLTSVYAIRLYELIVSWHCQNQNYKQLEIDNLRELLQIGKKHKRISDFKKFIINPALKQINEYTNYDLEISFRKCGRAIRWIQLRFKEKGVSRLNEKLRAKNRLSHPNEKEIERQRKLAEEKQKERLREFDKFKKDLTLEKDMEFLNKETKKVYKVEEQQNIINPEKKSLVININYEERGYFSDKLSLDEEEIKWFVFNDKLSVSNS